MDFTYETASSLLGGRPKRDIPCPFCSHTRKRGHEKLPCFGLRQTEPDKIVYNCQNCGETGAVTEGWGKPRTWERSNQRTPPTESRTKKKPSSNTPLAQNYWRQTVRPAGTLAEEYWLFRNLKLPIPPTIRFHPQSQSVTIAAAPAEYDAEGAWIAPKTVVGVHRTPIDLSVNSGHGRRLALGPIAGHPMVVHQNLDKLTVMIGEGVEKTHAAAHAYNVDGWSVGGNKMFMHLTEVIPEHMETVLLLEDPDAEKEIAAFADQLVDRGFEVLIIKQVGGVHAE